MWPGVEICWNDEKNRKLKAERGLAFEDVVAAIENGRVLADIDHHQTDRIGHQRILVVEIDGYACVVPYVEQGTRIFSKTIYHSRAMRKKYMVNK
jgi:uncharacterized DUF497 family protein